VGWPPELPEGLIGDLFDLLRFLFAYTSFKWSNLASNKAGVTVVVVGIGPSGSGPRRLYQHDEQDKVVVRVGTSITPYLTRRTPTAFGAI
jgi:hypothetical protein